MRSISFKIMKRRRGISPVIAVMLILGLTLAAVAALFLVVMPMLNLGLKPNLVLLEPNTFYDYDNDGLCDFMSLYISNEVGGTAANITSVTVIWSLDDQGGHKTWRPFTEDDILINEGDSKYVRFVALVDDDDELPAGAALALSIESGEAIVVLERVSGGILIETGDPVLIDFKNVNSNPVIGANIDFYKDTGEYAYSGELTDSEGRSTTYLFPGSYYARASEGFSVYYTDVFLHPGEGLLLLQVQGGELTVKVKAGASPIENAVVYVYDTFGHYLGKSGTTGADGIKTFSLENGMYKIRADVTGITYYSDDVDFPDQSYVEIDTGGGDIYCRVIDGGNNTIPNVRVYLFRANGRYFNMYDNTNDTGLAYFPAVPGGELFKFRVDYLAYRLWSQEFGASHGSIIDVNVGGGTIYVNVTDGSGNPIANTRTYLFTQTNRYTGKYANTNSSGIATYYQVAGGTFKIRVDYMAQRFWSPEFYATHGIVVQSSIGGGTLYGNITSGGTALDNVRVYLFTSTGRYTGRYGNTNSSGIVEIQGVGTGNYMMRVDFQANRHWSPVFYFNETTVVPYDIGGGTVYANVTSGGTPIDNVRVYVFTPTGRYTGTYANTNSSGIAEFATLGGGDYMFRVDYLARRFWSDVFTSADGLVVDVDLGGGTITVHLINNYGTNITGVRIYLFTEHGRYTGKYANTDGDGLAIFNGIGEANYMFRADYLALRYWSPVFLATLDLDFEFNIGGGIVFLHVFDGSGTDIDGPRAYLFTSTGRYTGFYANLDAAGYLNCSRIGNGTFMWRVDYLGKRFWSPQFEAINGSTLEFNIGGGTIYVHLTVDGADDPGHRIYLYTSTGSYTGKYADTNSTGWAEFYGIGDGDYYFRHRHGGVNYFSYFTASADLVVDFAISTSMLPLSYTTDTPIRRKLAILHLSNT
jgi:hypothetical protein